MPNHFHFLIRTREEITNTKSVVPNQLRKLFISYTIRINHHHGRVGSLFTKNYQRIEIIDEAYLHSLVKYIHKNPVKHGVQADFQSYPFSSYHDLANGKKTFLLKEDVFQWFGSQDAFVSYHLADNIDDRPFNYLNLEKSEEEI
jgi:hypothetical protein